MSWAKLDDSFWMHPKVLMVGNTASGIFARMLSYCAQHNIERIPYRAAEVIAGVDRRALRDLKAAAMLIDVGGGWCELDPPPEVHADPTARRLVEARAPGRASGEQIKARIDYYGGTCWICKVAPYEAIDHVKPLSKGGSKWPANLRPACRSCNSRKGAAWPYEVRFGT